MSLTTHEVWKMTGSRFGVMVVIATDQFAGRLYRCPCEKKVWSVFGHAARHARTCPAALGRSS